MALLDDSHLPKADQLDNLIENITSRIPDQSQDRVQIIQNLFYAARVNIFILLNFGSVCPQISKPFIKL